MGARKKKHICVAGRTDARGCCKFFFASWSMDVTRRVGVFEMGFPCFWRKSTFPGSKSSGALFEAVGLTPCLELSGSRRRFREEFNKFFIVLVRMTVEFNTMFRRS